MAIVKRIVNNCDVKLCKGSILKTAMGFGPFLVAVENFSTIADQQFCPFSTGVEKEKKTGKSHDTISRNTVSLFILR